MCIIAIRVSYQTFVNPIGAILSHSSFSLYLPLMDVIDVSS